MAMANDMSNLLTKIERRLGLTILIPRLPKELAKDKWADIIMQDTIVTWSRYYPNAFPIVVNDDTCDKKKENGTTWYYIKDEVLQGCKLLGLKDIDWMDMTTNNASLGGTSLGGGYYYPNMGCIGSTFESILSLQTAADMNSLYNRGLYIDFQYPNRFAIKGMGNTNYDLKSFVVILLVEHCSLSTISPTVMETFESLAQTDVARFLYMNLRYLDNLETIYLNIDLKLSELQEEANKRDEIINTIKESYVSTSNDNIPYIMTV
nr:MAG TPA: hypothetical protein [Herelleviridae sp.]